MRPVILVDAVVEVLASPDADRLEPPSRAIPQSSFAVADNDCLAIGLATVNDHPIGPTMALPWITVFTEPELDRVADAVDGAVEIHPAASDLNIIGFVHVPPAGDGPFAPVEAVQQLQREADDPAMPDGVIDAWATLSHHLFQIARAESAGKVPAYAQQDHRLVEWRPLNMTNPRNQEAFMPSPSLPKSLRQNRPK